MSSETEEVLALSGCRNNHNKKIKKMLRTKAMKKQLIMKKKVTIKTNTCNKMKNMVKMNIMMNKSRKTDGKKTKKRNKDEKQEGNELIIIVCPHRMLVHIHT